MRLGNHTHRLRVMGNTYPPPWNLAHVHSILPVALAALVAATDPPNPYVGRGRWSVTLRPLVVPFPEAWAEATWP